MGHIHDQHTFFVFPPLLYQRAVLAGSCNFAVVRDAGLWYARAQAAGGAPCQFEIKWPLGLLAGEASSQKGCYVRNLDLWYWASNVTTLDVAVYLSALPVDGAAFGAATAQAFSYDAGHDTNAERVANGYHKVALSFTSPFWLTQGYELYFKYLVELEMTGEIDFYGARTEGSLRL